jgi:hypothetical protein
MEDVGIFYVHLVYFTFICHFLWIFGMFPGYLVYFSGLVCYSKKNLAAPVDTAGSVVFVAVDAACHAFDDVVVVTGHVTVDHDYLGSM